MRQAMIRIRLPLSRRALRGSYAKGEVSPSKSENLVLGVGPVKSSDNSPILSRILERAKWWSLWRLAPDSIQ